MKIELLLKKFLPEGTLEDFEITGFDEEAGQEQFEEKYYIELTEKLYKPSGFGTAHVEQKGFSIKRVMDFPVRGRKTILVYRRRKWKIEDHAGIYMRPMEITAQGVKLSPEFAFFFETED